MADIDPEAVMAAHPRSEHVGGLTGQPFCESDQHATSTYWPCEPYRLAEALAAVVNLHTGLHRCIVDGVAGDYLYCPTARAIGVTAPDPYLRSIDA